MKDRDRKFSPEVKAKIQDLRRVLTDQDPSLETIRGAWLMYGDLVDSIIDSASPPVDRMSHQHVRAVVESVRQGKPQSNSTIVLGHLRLDSDTSGTFGNPGFLFDGLDEAQRTKATAFVRRMKEEY